ncbi:MAG TPA: azurin [Niabella sp.]|nr:azurin [Niabella sp.]
MKKTILSLAIATLLFTSCGGPDTQPASQETETAPTEATAPEAEASAEALITINGGDDMKFDLTEIKVKEGQTVKLTINHTGKAPATAMGHNFVLLAQGIALSEFANEAINAKDNDYIPAGREKDIIAHTKLIGGGESDSIEFTAPAKGNYEFLCSFPGHAAMMKGVFIVE